MPNYRNTRRFYFDVVSAGHVVRDMIGVACESVEEALAEAATAADEYAAECFRRGEKLGLEEIVVRDPQNREVGRINLRDLH
jgi:hypothetical protein